MKRDKVEAKDRLLAAGLKYFASKGFDGATVREICDEANSNIAAINYYFGDKQGFYSAVKEHALGIRQKAMDRCWELVETDPWGALRMQIELMLDETFDDTMFQVSWLFLRELLDQDENADKKKSEETLYDLQTDARRKLYIERMTRLLTGLLGPESATSDNLSLLHYTYHSLCRFLPIKTQWESRVLQGKGRFIMKANYDKATLADYIMGIVRHAVEEMQKKVRDKKN